jgi:alkylglycerol monooxygenase
MDSSLIAFSIPVFFVLIGIESLVARRRGRRLYRFQDTINSLSCGAGQQAVAVGLAAWTVGSYVWIYETLRIGELDSGAVWVWVFGAIAVDFAYYRFHRASHRVGFLWAAHVVHHQSEEYNLSTALRQSAIQAALGVPFYWPLAVLGLPPAAFLILTTTNTLYQFWIHTRLVPKLGPLELVLNTPSHHRVHHGIDPKYIDRNHGGVLIVWDRLFGTFEEEQEEPAYGTVKPLRSWNPLWANVQGWARMVAIARATRRLRDKAWTFLAPPEWRPHDLGGPVTIPEVDHASRELYARSTRRGLHRYVLVQFAVVSLVIVRVLTAADGAPGTSALVSWVLASLVAWGGLLEDRRWAPALEHARLLALPVVVFVATPADAWALVLTFVALALALAASTWFRSVWRQPIRPAET